MKDVSTFEVVLDVVPAAEPNIVEVVPQLNVEPKMEWNREKGGEFGYGGG
jgi:hypothetical protein